MFFRDPELAWGASETPRSIPTVTGDPQHTCFGARIEGVWLEQDEAGRFIFGCSLRAILLRRKRN